jgi:rRNA maturation endonuclease Nob1
MTELNLEHEQAKDNIVKPDVSGSLPCRCLKCSPNVFPNMRFNVCPICGNKRCPHASDHNYECTNSNDVGQTGSVYGGNDR